MIMLLYVLRLTSFFMRHVSAIKKALISSFTCPVAAFTHTHTCAHTKCKMCYLLSVVVVCRCGCACWLNVWCFCFSMLSLYIFNIHAVQRSCICLPHSISAMIVALMCVFFYLHVRTCCFYYMTFEQILSFFADTLSNPSCECVSTFFLVFLEYI